MATKTTGWACTHSASIISETNTNVTIRVTCYWQNQGWKYNISGVTAYVYCNGEEYKVMNSGSVNSTSNNTLKNIITYNFTLIINLHNTR